MMPSKLKRVIRLDSQPLNQTFFTAEGYLMDRPILTSTGIFEYANPDGSVRRELRLPEEVFDSDSLKSYRGKPIIVTHDAGLITKDNVAENTVGTILSEGYRSGEDVRAEIVIHDADVLKDSGYRELSLGYNLDLDETPGVYNGEPYDAIQRNIRINHLALVNEARAGEQARLNIDSRDTALKGGKPMKKTRKRTSVRVDSILTPDELKKAVAEYKARRAKEFPAAADADEETPVIVVTEEPEVKACDDDTTVIVPDLTNPAEIEEAVAIAKERQGQRNADADPTDLSSAQDVIAEQDKDLTCLFDIIDTLLAQIEFDSDEETEEETEAATEETETEESNEDDDVEETTKETAEETTEETAEDDDEEEETEEVNEDDDDDDVPSKTVAELPVLNADSIDRIVRERVKIAKAAEALNMDGLESIKPMKAKKTIIRAVKPGVRLDGKSAAYVNAMFDLACQELQKRSRKDTAFQRKQMFNKDARSNTGNSTEAARQKMIQRMQKSK